MEQYTWQGLAALVVMILTVIAKYVYKLIQVYTNEKIKALQTEQGRKELVQTVDDVIHFVEEHAYSLIKKGETVTPEQKLSLGMETLNKDLKQKGLHLTDVELNKVILSRLDVKRNNQLSKT